MTNDPSASGSPLELRPLALDEALRLLARVAWSADAPPEAEREAAVTLVERLGRLPLALEIAGQTIRRTLLPAAQYLADLEACGEGVAADDLARIDATLTRSLRELEPADERVLLALATLPAAGARARDVATCLDQPEPEVARRLDLLVQASLADLDAAAGRYQQHALLRAAGRRRLRRDDEAWAALHRGAARALLALALWVNEPAGERTDEVRRRWAQVRAVLDGLEPEPWLAGAPGGADVARAIALADRLRSFERGLADRERQLEVAARLAAADVGALGRVHLARAALRGARGDLAGAEADHELALGHFLGAGDQQGGANTLKDRGDLRLLRGDLTGAERSYEAALSLYRALGDRLGQANTHGSRAEVRFSRGDIAGTESDHESALALYQVVGDRLGQANTLQARSDLRSFQGDLERAELDCDAALALYQVLEERGGQAIAHRSRAVLRRQRKDLAAAAADCEAALALSRAVEDRLGEANSLLILAHLRRDQGHPGAESEYLAALALFRIVGDPVGQASANEALGSLALERRDFVGAVGRYRAALALIGEGSAWNRANALADLASALQHTGPHDEAWSAAEEAVRLGEAIGNDYATSTARNVLDDLAGEDDS